MCTGVGRSCARRLYNKVSTMARPDMVYVGAHPAIRRPAAAGPKEGAAWSGTSPVLVGYVSRAGRVRLTS